MPAVFNLPKKTERKQFEKKRSQQFKKTSRKVRKMEFETKQKNQKWSLIVEDFVVNVPIDDKDNSQNIQSKRKLPLDDDEWELPPNRRRQKIKSYHNSMYDNNGYSSDQFDDGDVSHVVPDWKFTEDDSRGIPSSDSDDTLSSKDAEVQIIDDVIQFDSLNSASGYELVEPTICFDMLKEEESIVLDLKDDEPKKSLDVLLAFTNDSQIVFYDDDEKRINEVENIEKLCPLLECNDCWDIENCKDEWQDDCQLEKLNFARCFKCRQKVKRFGCSKT